MCALRSEYFPPSNRRRCVTGRPSYTETSDTVLSGSKQDQNSNSDDFFQNEDSYIHSVASDGEEEPITIDLSAFLNENPLLAESAFQSSAENNVAATESSSQFRVTDCELNPSEVQKTDVVNTSSSLADVSGSNLMNNNATNEKGILPLSVNSCETIHDNSKENCLSPDKVLSNGINGEPIHNITLNGKKSPTKKFCRARPLGLSNPLKKYKNFIKSKDLNKANEKVFGKYPVVKCEKLDIENFVKNNKIKISNWPLYSTESQKNENITSKSPVKKKINVTKGTLKPKFMRKPINLNKYLINSNKSLTQNSGNTNILGVTTSKPIVIKTDSWKPGVANTSPNVTAFFRNFVKTSLVAPKTVVSDPFKDQAVNKSIIYSPVKEISKRNTFAANINKIFSSPKNYQLIAPKPVAPSLDLITPSLSKPVESLIEPLLDDFTVIEPYVEDPTSPQKPKPILTVPVEVIASPEKQNTLVHPSITINTDSSEKADKSKSGKSVFLNGACKQISSPIKIKRNVSIIKRDSIKKPLNHENLLDNVIAKAPDIIKEKEASAGENPSILKAKNVVVDAMQSVFSSTQKKKKLKPKLEKISVPGDLLGATSYCSILNDNLLLGFSENDFENSSFCEDDSFTNTSHDIFAPPHEYDLNKVNECIENSNLTSKIIKKVRKRKKFKRKRSLTGESASTSDTMSASECENGNIQEKTSRRKRTPAENASGSTKSPHELCKKYKKLDPVVDISFGSVQSEDFSNMPDNKTSDSKHVDSSLSFSNLENHLVTESHTTTTNNNNKLIPSETGKPEILNAPPNESFAKNVENSVSNKKHIKEYDNSRAQETCTRTLRERKCSSTEMDKSLDNSIKQSPYSKNSLEKSKIKGSINSKLKIQLKSPKSNSKVKIKRKPCKPEDIIREVNTITGGHPLSKNESNKCKKLEKGVKSDLTSFKGDSQSNSSKVSFPNKKSHSFSKRRKSLKVCIKRSKKKKSASSLKMSLNSLTDVIENANSTSSMSENNVNVHSSFREGKGEKMGTLQKEENSPENNTSISDCTMEIETDEKYIHEENKQTNAQDPLVNSENSLLQDTNNNIHCDVTNSVSDPSLLIESQNNENELINEDFRELSFENYTSKKSNISSEEICDISQSSENNEKSYESTFENPSLVVETMSNLLVQSEGIPDNGTDINFMGMGVPEFSISSAVNSKMQGNFKNGNDCTGFDNFKAEENTNKDYVTLIDKDVTDFGQPVIEEVVVTEETSIDSCVISTELNAGMYTKEESPQLSFVDVVEDLVPESNNEVIVVDDNVLQDIESHGFSNMPTKCNDNHEENKIITDILSVEHTDKLDLVEASKNVLYDSSIVVDTLQGDEKTEGDFTELSETASFKCVSIDKNKIGEQIDSNLDIACNDLMDNIEDLNESKLTEDNKVEITKTSEEASLESAVENNKIEEEISKKCDLQIHTCEEFNEPERIECNEINFTESFEKVPSESVIASNKVNVTERNADEVQVDTSEKMQETVYTDSGVEMNLLSSKSQLQLLSPEKYSVNEENDKSSSTVISKKCPKIKISFKKSNVDSPDNSENWFISESKECETVESSRSSKESSEAHILSPEHLLESEISRSAGDILPETSVSSSVSLEKIDIPHNKEYSVTDDTLNSFSDESPSIDNDKTLLRDKSVKKLNTSIADESLLTDDNKSSPKEISTTEISNFNSDEKSLPDKSRTSSKGSPSKKIHMALSDENTLVSDNEALSGNMAEEINTTCPGENILTDGSKTSLTDLSPEKTENDFDSSITIKKEPLDSDENQEVEEQTSIRISNVKSVNRKLLESGKKKRGRPRKSADSGRPIEVKKEVETEVQITPERLESKISPTSNSSGQKRKISQGLTSTPIPRKKHSDSRKKNYDPELVSIPLLKGWSREHVIRSTGKDDKRASDIYYFTPGGVKLRSMPEILSFLSRNPDNKYSAVNFTFAKELVFRHPFEYERHAKQKVSVTPKKTVLKTAKKAVTCAVENSPVSIQDSKSSESVLASSDSKKKTVVKRKSSSSKETESFLPDSKNDSLSDSKTTRKPRQVSLTKYLNVNKEKTSDKSPRSSRKIVKKVPFDNSDENKLAKKSKPDASVRQNSNESIKKESKEKESLVLKSPHTSNSPTVTKEPKNYSRSPVTKKIELPVSGTLPSSSPGGVSSIVLPSRTNIKSPIIQKRLKVRLTQRKSELLHKPCTRFCNFSSFQAPSIKCSICLCLFHPECIPFKPIGLTKFACVPCVHYQLNSSVEKDPEEIFFPAGFDMQKLYPSIRLDILSDPFFNATFNKFFSPVDSSFMQCNTEGQVQPRLTYVLNPSNYSVDKVNLNPVQQHTSTQKTNVWHPPSVPFDPSCTAHKGFRILASVPVQKTSSGFQTVCVRNPGSLPLLQNFSKSFFLQNQPCHKNMLSNSANFQNSLLQMAANEKSATLSVPNTCSSSKMQNTIIFRKISVDQQKGGMLPSYQILPTTKATSEPTVGTSVLQTMLQSSDKQTVKEAKSDNCLDFNYGDESNMPSIQSESVNIKRKNTTSPGKTPKKLKCDQSIRTESSARAEHFSAFWDINKFAQIYECLNFIFKFLNVCDLLRASLVCKSWKHLASQKLLWESVSFSGTTIKNWDKCCKTLQMYGTKCIDFRGFYDQDSDDAWNGFCKNVNYLNEVEELIFEKIPPFVVIRIADSLPQLRRLTCYCLTSIFTEPEIWSTPCDFELSSLRCLGRLEALKISSMGGIHLNESQKSLMPYLPNLTHVVLTGFKFRSYMNLECLSQQKQLTTLELGDCVDIEPQIYGLLAQLTNLSNLCLQNGGNVNDEKLPEALLKMSKLKTLELMNFQVSCHLPDVLKKMDSLHHFSLWPDNRSEAALVNFYSYDAATSGTNLKGLCWGILTDDDTVPNELELKDPSESDVKKLSYQELFQSLVKHYPGVKVEVKCLPRSIWSEFCSSRNFV